MTLRFVHAAAFALALSGPWALAHAQLRGTTPEPAPTPPAKSPAKATTAGKDAGEAKGSAEAKAGKESADPAADARSGEASAATPGKKPAAAKPKGALPKGASPLTPRPDEMSPPRTSAKPAEAEMDALASEIATLRARIAAVSDNLFRARLRVSARFDGSSTHLRGMRVAIDDGTVFQSKKGFSLSDEKTLYDHAVAPGRHTVTIEVDANDAVRDLFQTRHAARYVVEVPRDERVELEVRIDERSTLGEDFEKDREGRYELRMRADVASHKLER